MWFYRRLLCLAILTVNISTCLGAEGEIGKSEVGPAQSDIDDLMSLLRRAQSDRIERLRGWSVSYEISMNRMVSGKSSTGDLEDRWSYHGQLTQQGENWRHEVNGARMSGKKGILNATTTASFVEGRRNTLISTEGARGASGMIDPDDSLRNELSYLSFGLNIDGLDVPDFVTKHRNELRSIAYAGNTITAEFLSPGSLRRTIVRFDADRGFNPVRWQTVNSSGDIVADLTVEYLELEPHLWMPASGRHVVFDKLGADKSLPVSEIILTVSGIDAFQYGKKYSQNELAVVFPYGTAVHDHIARIRYVIGDIDKQALQTIEQVRDDEPELTAMSVKSSTPREPMAQVRDSSPAATNDQNIAEPESSPAAFNRIDFVQWMVAIVTFLFLSVFFHRRMQPRKLGI